MTATLLLLSHHRWAYAAALGAGTIMTGWIIVEVVLIGQISWLQWVYLVNGLAMIGLVAIQLRQTPRPTRILHHVAR